MKTQILIVEDDQGIVEAVHLALQTYCPEVELISCGDGKGGIELVESRAPDVVILDLGLPDIEGFEVLEQIRLFSAVPVLILSVRDEEKDIAKAKQLGANEYVVKPFKHSTLLPQLREMAFR